MPMLLMVVFATAAAQVGAQDTTMPLTQGIVSSEPTTDSSAELGADSSSELIADSEPTSDSSVEQGAEGDVSLSSETSPGAATTPKRAGTPSRNRRQKGKNKNRCRIYGCARCSRTDRNACDFCRAGFALTPEATCGACGQNCQSCTTAGPGKCDTCKKGFTFDAIAGECRPCAAHCHRCDEAGPGGCNECGPRRMLDVRLELHGEVHECLPCGSGCRQCSVQHGCEACDSFYSQLPNGAGCTFSWLRVGLLLGVLLAAIGGCIFVLGPEETYDPYNQRAKQRKDAAAVVRTNRDGADLRRRGGSRPDQSPQQERKESAYTSAYSQHLLPGYSGIDIIDS